MDLSRAAWSLGVIGIVIVLVGHAQAQTPETIEVTVRPSESVEQKVANEIKEKQLREAAEDRIAKEKSAQSVSTSPKMLLSHARTIFITTNTTYFEPVQVQNELRKRPEFNDWAMAIVDGWEKQKIADIVVEIDRPFFTFTYTYKITDRSSGILLATGKLNAFDGNAAAPRLAERIVEEIKDARGESKKKGQK